MRRPVEVGEEGVDLGACEDDGESFGAFGGGDPFQGRQGGAENVPIEEQDGAAGDVLRGGGDLVFGGEVGQVASDFRRSEAGGVSFAVKVDELLDAVEVGFFGAEAIMAQADRVAHFFQKCRDAHGGSPFRGY